MNYTPQFFTITGGQAGIISGGCKNFSITIQSGIAAINNVIFWAPQAFAGGADDSRMTMTPGTNIIVSGVGAGARVNYAFW